MGALGRGAACCALAALFAAAQIAALALWQQPLLRGLTQPPQKHLQRSLDQTPCPPHSRSPLQGSAPQGSAQANRLAAERRGVRDHRDGETIFVALASYGDTECAPTIQRAFARAAAPDRIFFGVYQQHNCTHGDEEVCHDCVAALQEHISCPEHPLCSRLWQVRVTRLHMMETRGVTYGRHQAERHYRGQTYVMGIDSHSHFLQGWDSELVDMFHRIGDDHAVITTYPAAYYENQMGHQGSDGFQLDPFPERQMCICRTNREKVYHTVSFKNQVNYMSRPKQRPVRVAFLAAGFNFARGHRVAAVPYDPYTPFLFDGEEISLAVRLWTHGYEFYQPDRDTVAHLYIFSGSKLRPVFWTHDWGTRYLVQYHSMLRVNWLLGLHDLIDPQEPMRRIDTREADRYGVGTVRRAQQYWDWAGVQPGREGPRASRDLCPVYEAGGMPQVRRPGIDP